jgi:glyoxylase-like metal-dependent hydrolase (beta-lactamase superfamily II)
VKQEQERATDDVVEVGPNVLRMQLPMSHFTGLGHVNSYALIDDRGAAVIDPGLPGPPTWHAIQDRLKKAGVAIRNVHTVIVTHSHPDHFGSAGKLAKEAGAELVTHSAFRTWWRNQDDCDEVHDVDPEDFSNETPWGSNPWGGTNFKPPLRRRMMFRLMRSGLMRNRIVPANPTQRLKNGDVIKLAGREFFAVHTPGHTIDHLCLHDPEGGLLFTGDHVLPTITPHIAGVGGGRDPLKLFKDSLDKVAALPQIDTVLPAHGHPFSDLPGRVEAIKAHHEERCDKLREVSKALGPTTVTELSHHLFRKERWGGMAESETYAHLEHLRLLGQAESHEENGQLIYEIAAK